MTTQMVQRGWAQLIELDRKPSLSKVLLMVCPIWASKHSVGKTLDTLTHFVCLQTVSIQAGYEICLKPGSNLMRETILNSRSVCSQCTLKLQRYLQGHTRTRAGAPHSHCSLGSPQSSFVISKLLIFWLLFPWSHREDQCHLLCMSTS